MSTIVAYTGLPGSGKSYSVVEYVLIPALKAGRCVVHNMKLSDAELLAHCGSGSLVGIPEGSNAAQVVEFCGQYPGAIIVLDEPWRYWPAGMTAKNIPEAQREFFAMARHKVDANGESGQIVLCTQDLGQIAAFARALVQQTFRMCKLTAVGQTGRFRVDMYEGAVTGPKPPESQLIRQTFGKYEEAVWKFYRSHTQSEAGKVGKESRTDTRASALKGWQVKAAGAALLALPVALYGAYRSVSRMGRHDAENAAAATVAPQAASAASVASAPPPITPVSLEPKPSTTWKLVGQVFRDGTVTYLVATRSATRKIPSSLCAQDAADNIVCTVDGELVAEWTGPRSDPMKDFMGGSLESAKGS